MSLEPEKKEPESEPIPCDLCGATLIDAVLSSYDRAAEGRPICRDCAINVFAGALAENSKTNSDLIRAVLYSLSDQPNLASDILAQYAYDQIAKITEQIAKRAEENKS